MRKILSSERLSTLAQAWPGGPEDLFAEFRAQGFKIEGDTPELKSRLASLWEGLAVPRGYSAALETEADALKSYSYVSTDAKEAKSPHRWGLLLCDSKMESVSWSAHAAIQINHADAAMDWVLQTVLAPEWSGESVLHPWGRGIVVEPGVVIGPGCELGDHVILETGVRLGARVRIGAGSRIGAHSRLADDTVVGERAYLKSHVSLGGQGFGFVQYPGSALRVPRVHVGRVFVGSHARMGSFVGVDRGVFEDTVIGDHASFDNFVQIGHNCDIGREALFCGFVGLSGSTSVGDRVTIAGLSGTQSHVKIGSDVLVAAQSGVSRNLRDGEKVKGYPPLPLRVSLKVQSLVTKLPELYERLKKLEKDSQK